MSIITAIKEGNELVFCADSRMMAHDYSAVDCDTQQKVFEIAPSTFLGTSGRLMASEFQIARARELAAELGTTDIQVIGAELEKETLGCLKVLLERLRQEPDETTRQAVAGDTMLHGCMLVGRDSAGKLGYLNCSWWVRADGIKCETETYFDAPRKVACIAGTPAALMAKLASKFMWDAATWMDPLEAVSLRWLKAVKEVTPTIGGRWQILQLDASGAHWLSQLPAGDHASETAAGTCSATVAFTSPIITVSGSGWTINLDTTNGFKATKGNSVFKVNMSSTTVQSFIQDTGANAITLWDALGVSVSQAGYGSAALSPNNVTASNGSVNSTLTSDGLTIVNGAGTFTGTLAAAIAAGKTVKNGSIMN
jgi:hypothetical protein